MIVGDKGTAKEMAFYVRLEDGITTFSAIWDDITWDIGSWDAQMTLADRIVASNNRRLRGLE